ncbi:hypothetical protein ABT294_42755 [Nonomuraea sp. NPDC000554]|uniref:hypothetical protein n=1 Tax=Nonomuraea sp. NPDC000554 TaxID=3154259 RepID=UPI0033252557
MATRSGTVLAAGSANAAKLFVAALAFTGAYTGLSAYGIATSAPDPAGHTVNLSARELPITRPIAAERPATAGEVSVSALPGGSGCVRTFSARALVGDEQAEQAVSYRWRLARWSPDTRTWHTYLVHHAGFAGTERTVDWEEHVTGDPGWYRVDLAVEGAKTIRSDRFRMSC